MATSEIQICCNALLLLGDRPISSFSENTDRALLASNLWDTARQAVLRAHPWNCAKEMVALAPESAAPAFDWDYKFLLPGDCLRVLFVGQEASPDDYLVNGRRILANANPLYLTYIYDNADVASWDASLAQAMEVYMAARMAYPITKSSTLRDSMFNEYQSLLRQAKSIDGQEEPPEQAGDFPFIQARN